MFGSVFSAIQQVNFSLVLKIPQVSLKSVPKSRVHEGDLCLLFTSRADDPAFLYRPRLYMNLEDGHAAGRAS